MHNGIDEDDDEGNNTQSTHDDPDSDDEGSDSDEKHPNVRSRRYLNRWNRNANAEVPRPRGVSSASYSIANSNGQQSPDVSENPPPRPPARPAAPTRMPSSTYAPDRTPHPHPHRGDPRILAQPKSYKSTEQQYLEKMRSQNIERDYFNSPGNLSFYQTESELEDESPSADMHYDNSEQFGRMTNSLEN